MTPPTLRSSVVRRLGALTAIAVAVSLVAGCPQPRSSRYERKLAQASLKKLGTPGIVVGEFNLTKVVDGDTVRVDGLDSSLRLNGLDCEETFKNEHDRRGADTDFEEYLSEKRKGKHPVKAATPMGDAAKDFAKAFFADSPRVRIERDDPREIRDTFDRYLAYVFARKNGVWVNYNVEAVRAGMSPYFMKYGYSRRFHQEFTDAQAEAQREQRGIWSPMTQHYPDYDERFPWWIARAEFLARYQRQIDADPTFIVLNHWDAMTRIEKLEGKEVTVLGLVGDVQLGDRGPTKVLLSRKRTSSFPLIFFDKDVFAASQVADWKGEFIVVKGVVTSYVNKHTKRKQLQIQVDHASQLTLSPIPGLDPPGTSTASSN